MLNGIISMRVAIPEWEGRISPTMDTAGNLLVVEIVGGHEVSRRIIPIPPMNLVGRARFISGLKIDRLICGAISHQLEQMLSGAGVPISPWFGGQVDDIIAAHTRGNLENEDFWLPGCRRRRGHRGYGCRRGRRGGRE
nr:hypothetical protein [candidate division Zixibacteria bacterium]